ncbi:MAG: radical SAM protein, partial [Isosphaeraceae bacterium]
RLVVELFSTSHSPDSSAWTLRQLLCCLPELTVPPQLTYDKIFRVLIVQFLDPYNFDVRSVKKSCIHIVHPDGRIIPFDTYNLFYRDTAAARMPAAPGDVVLPILAGGTR